MASKSDETVAPNDTEENATDPVLSMVDYLNEEQELQNDVDAVLGDSDDNRCTYPLGYTSRQALYACKTCETNDKVPAGVCLACSYACHDGHDLYELYTKRNFRCDCGNSKYTGLTCKLYADKDEYNCDNKYNQNFKGLYCICSRPYPDPEDEIEDEMIQCIMCEDWYHGRHLGGLKTPSSFQEMICTSCMSKHEFLWAYTTNSQDIKMEASDSDTSAVDVEKTDSTESVKAATSSESGASTAMCGGNTDSKAESDDKSTEVSKLTTDGKSTEVSKLTTDGKSAEVSGTSTHPGKDDNANEQKETCLLDELTRREVTVAETATFWQEGFRAKLCVCSKCKGMYNERGLSFLPDETDTVMAYETRGKEKRTPSTQHDRERRALQGMNHVQQIEVMQGFNDMKSALSDYLKHFADNGKVVREEDIREFFSQMQARKRQRTDQTPSYLCK